MRIQLRFPSDLFAPRDELERIVAFLTENPDGAFADGRGRAYYYHDLEWLLEILANDTAAEQLRLEMGIIHMPGTIIIQNPDHIHSLAQALRGDVVDNERASHGQGVYRDFFHGSVPWMQVELNLHADMGESGFWWNTRHFSLASYQRTLDWLKLYAYVW
jgi:hypothetical protein